MATSNPFAHLVKNQPASDEPSSKQEKDVLEDEGATIPVHLPEKVGQHEPLEGDTQITDQARIVQTIDRTIQKVFLVTVDSGTLKCLSLLLISSFSCFYMLFIQRTYNACLTESCFKTNSHTTE